MGDTNEEDFLLVIDVQKDFTTGGNLEVKGGEKVVAFMIMGAASSREKPRQV